MRYLRLLICIKRCKSSIFGGESCDIFSRLDDIEIRIGTIGRYGD